MKFTLVRNTAQVALAQALKTCNTKAVGKADSEFLIREAAGQLSVTSLNDTAEQTLVLQAEGLKADDGEGFSVSGQSLVELLRDFPDEQVALSYDATKAIVVVSGITKKTKFVFPTGDPEDFIPFSYHPQGISVEVDGTAFAAALKATAFAASQDNTLAPRTAVKVSLAGDKLIAEATDNSRISVYNIQVDDIGTDTINMLLPRATAEALSGLVDGIACVTVRPGTRHVRFEWNDTIMTCSLENEVGKPFPNLGRFMGGSVVASARISRTDLLRSLKLAALVAKYSYIGVQVGEGNDEFIKKYGDGVLLTTDERTRGVSQDVVVKQSGKGAAKVLVAHSYMSKAVEMSKSPWIDLEFLELKPGIVAVCVCDGPYRHLVFPVTPNENSSDGD